MGEDCCDTPGVVVEETTNQKVVKFLLLFSAVPVFFSLPYVAGYVVEFCMDKEEWFYPLWVVYGVCWLYLAAKKYRQHTWESWFTQLLTWALFSLGIFTVIGVFNFVDVRTKRTILIVWCSLTFLPYLYYVYQDEVDHRKEAERQARKEQRRKEKAEQLKKEKLEKKLARKKAALEQKNE